MSCFTFFSRKLIQNPSTESSGVNSVFYYYYFFVAGKGGTEVTSTSPNKGTFSLISVFTVAVIIKDLFSGQKRILFFFQKQSRKF